MDQVNFSITHRLRNLRPHEFEAMAHQAKAACEALFAPPCRFDIRVFSKPLTDYSQYDDQRRQEWEAIDLLSNTSLMHTNSPLAVTKDPIYGWRNAGFIRVGIIPAFVNKTEKDAVCTIEFLGVHSNQAFFSLPGAGDAGLKVRDRMIENWNGWLWHAEIGNEAVSNRRQTFPPFNLNIPLPKGVKLPAY